MKEIKAAIFDVDGTILDSMPTWHDCGARFLRSIGIEPEEGLGDRLFTETSETGAEYLIETYGLAMTREEVAAGLNREMENFYKTEAVPKEGAAELLAAFSERGIPMTVATSTDRYMVMSALDRLDLTKYFTAVYTCGELATTKSEPKIFFKAAEAMGSEPADTWVFEDGLYAVRTAASAGFRTVGVYDEISASEQEALAAESDRYVLSLTELKPL